MSSVQQYIIDFFTILAGIIYPAICKNLSNRSNFNINLELFGSPSVKLFSWHRQTYQSTDLLVLQEFISIKTIRVDKLPQNQSIIAKTKNKRKLHS